MKHVHHWHLEGAEHASRLKGEAVHHITGICACKQRRRFKAFVDAVTLGDSILGVHRLRLAEQQAKDEAAL